MANIFEGMTLDQAEDYMKEINRKSALQHEIFQELNDAMEASKFALPGSPEDDEFQRKQRELFQRALAVEF